MELFKEFLTLKASKIKKNTSLTFGKTTESAPQLPQMTSILTSDIKELIFLKYCCPFLTTLVSGSPIIQNGKLVGAVTHVMVADPTEGYGIFIENMLSASKGEAQNKAA